MRISDWSSDVCSSDLFCYLEDVDLGFRMRLSGHRCLQVVDARVHHVGGVSSGGDGSDFARYHGTRNHVWCFAKNMPLPLLLALAPAHALLMTALLLRNALRGQGRTTAHALADPLGGLERKRVVSGKSVAVRGEIGWGRIT